MNPYDNVFDNFLFIEKSLLQIAVRDVLEAVEQYTQSPPYAKLLG